jgi:hypothetical protein
MSALGQKQTYAPQQAMSALHLIATTKADVCQWFPPKADIDACLHDVRFTLQKQIQIDCVSAADVHFDDAPVFACGWTSVQRDFDNRRPNLRREGSRVEATYLGGRDVESISRRSDCSLRLHFVRNSCLTSLIARGKCVADAKQRFSGGWTSAHRDERRGCQSQSESARGPAILPAKYRKQAPNHGQRYQPKVARCADTQFKPRADIRRWRMARHLARPLDFAPVTLADHRVRAAGSDNQERSQC